MDNYDVAIIGAGQAGVPLAYALTARNKHVALIERKHVGGSCVNFGCTPTKAAITSARLAHLARRASEFGLRIPAVEVDFGAVIRRARGIVDQQRSSLERGLASIQNLKLIRGHGRLAGREGEHFRIAAGDTTITAAQVVIDTGTRSLIPPIDGISDMEIIHAGNWLDHFALPQRLVVIGAGVIALEMAQFYRRMGSEVVAIEPMSQIAGSQDPDIAATLQSILEREGIEFHLESKVERVARRGDAVVATVSGGQEIVGSDLFVATGRKPNTDDLGLDTIGVEVQKGIVKVDERLATTVAGVWAAGDVRGGPMFTHTAWDDHRILLSQLTGDGSRTTDRVVPYAIFTDPEVGHVGMNETEAKKAGRNFQVVRFEIRRNSKAVELGEPDGCIKVLIDPGTKQLLGATILSTEASELVHIYIEAMTAGLPYTAIRDAIFIHPTLAEAVQSAVTV